MKKLLSLCLAISIVLSLFAGIATADEAELLPMKLLVKRSTISASNAEERVMMDLSTFDSYEGDTQYKQVKARLAEEVGIDIQLEVVENEQLETAVKTKLASGQGLPDLLYVGDFTTSQIIQYGRDGIFVNLLDAFAEYDEDGSIVEFLNAYYPDYLASAATEDGAVYNITTLSSKYFVDMPEDWTYCGNSEGILIRGDWLDKLGIEYTPFLTTEEFKDLMVTFREQDANGNGVADEVIALDPTYIKSYGLNTAFGYNRRITYNYTTDELNYMWYNKEATIAYIEYLQELIDLDLFDLSVVGNSDARSALMTSDRASVIRDMLTETWSDPQVADPNCQYLPIVVSSDYAKNNISFSDRHGDFVGGWAIPASGNVEAAVRLLDWLCRYDTTMYRRYGVEGVNCTIDERGLYDFIDNGWDPSMDYNWGMVEDAVGVPRIQIVPYCGEFYYEYTKKDRTNAFLKDVLERNFDYEILELQYPMAAATDEELEVLQEIETDLITYMDETFAKLVLKQYSLDDFDKYVDEMKSLGLDEYYNIYRARIDRYLGK